jgi:hypothetical protein
MSVSKSTIHAFLSYLLYLPLLCIIVVIQLLQSFLSFVLKRGFFFSKYSTCKFHVLYVFASVYNTMAITGEQISLSGLLIKICEALLYLTFPNVTHISKCAKNSRKSKHCKLAILVDSQPDRRGGSRGFSAFLCAFGLSWTRCYMLGRL